MTDMTFTLSIIPGRHPVYVALRRSPSVQKGGNSPSDILHTPHVLIRIHRLLARISEPTENETKGGIGHGGEAGKLGRRKGGGSE